MAKKDKEAKKVEEGADDKTTPMSSYEIWVKKKSAELADKVRGSRERLEKNQEKLDTWLEKTESQRNANVRSNFKSKLLRPEKMYSKLAAIGEDLVVAYEEGIPEHRIKRILDHYKGMLQKVNVALKEAEILNADFPDVVEDALRGRFEWNRDTPLPLRNEDGLFSIEAERGSVETDLGLA